MAFPTGYAKYQEITIDHTKVAGDLTDYVVYVNLADLVKGGADIFDTCRSDGGDIRATKTDGSTELAVEVVAIDTTAKTGEIHIKFSGTLSSSTDTVIRIYYNGTDTLPAVSATYGRNNVWSDYVYVGHLQTSSLDSTGSANGSDTSITYGSSYGKIGQGATFNGSSSRIDLGNGREVTSGLTLSAWVKSSATIGQMILSKTDGNSPSTDSYYLFYFNSSGTMRLQHFIRTGSVNHYLDSVGSAINLSTRSFVASTHDLTYSKIYVNASLNTTSASWTGALNTASSKAQIGAYASSPTIFINGDIDEARIANAARSGNWLTTEYNNQNSASTFYATGNELGGSTIVSPFAQVATFSLPAKTITAGAVLGVSTQSLSFSIPAYAVSGKALVSVNAQTATFSIPTYMLIAAGIIFPAGVKALTFSIPTYAVLTGVELSPNTQTLTITLPANTVTGAALVSVNPVVLTLTIPTLEYAGAIWGRTARSTTGADWTRSAINNA